MTRTPFTSSIFIIGGTKMVGLSEDELIVAVVAVLAVVVVGSGSFDL